MMMIITYDNYNDDNYSITIVYAVYIQHIIHAGRPGGGWGGGGGGGQVAPGSQIERGPSNF